MQTWVGAEAYTMLGPPQQLKPEDKKVLLTMVLFWAGVYTWLVSDSPGFWQNF